MRAGVFSSMRILLVEDDPRMRALVRKGLSEDGHIVDVADSGPAALEAAGGSIFDAVVLDVMLPGISGVEVVSRLRARGNRTPVLMLTARDAAADVVSGLDAGADDYLAKPFSFKVLLARLRALGRRAPGFGPRLQTADVTLDGGAHVVTRAGVVVQLTPTEFKLLELLMRNVGRVVTRQMLIERLWGGEHDVESNTLDAFVKSLRQKLDAGDRPRLIQTVRGVGYSLREEPE
jgi:DNA-binding response OmpR family regulator